jgi:hypothetical protein
MAPFPQEDTNDSANWQKGWMGVFRRLSFNFFVLYMPLRDASLEIIKNTL